MDKNEWVPAIFQICIVDDGEKNPHDVRGETLIGGLFSIHDETIHDGHDRWCLTHSQTGAVIHKASKAFCKRLAERLMEHPSAWSGGEFGNGSALNEKSRKVWAKYRFACRMVEEQDKLAA